MSYIPFLAIPPSSSRLSLLSEHDFYLRSVGCPSRFHLIVGQTGCQVDADLAGYGKTNRQTSCRQADETARGMS